MQSAKRYGRLAIAGVAAAAVVTGCASSSGGGGSGGSSPHALLVASVGKTQAAKNARLHIEVKASGAGKSFALAGDGVIDFVGKKFQISLTLPAEAGISGTIEERLVGKDLYLKLPEAVTAATGGKAWIKLDLSSFHPSSKNPLDTLRQDPTQFLSTLRSVSDTVTKVGTEDIRGVKTTHYRAQVDLRKAAAAGGAGTSGLDEYQKLLGSTTLPEDVYLDDNGLARRFAVSINPVPPTSSSGSSSTPSHDTVSTTVDLYDFGSTDTSGIVAPPASEVGSLPTGLGGGLFG